MHALRRWKEEKRAAYLYRILSDRESGTVRQLLFLELADEADRQAALWAQEARKSGGLPPGTYSMPPWIKIVAWWIRSLPFPAIRPLLAAMRLRGLSVYSAARPAAIHPSYSAVSWMNDGLIATTLLVMGISGASAPASAILLVGTLGLLAGACVAAAGEWTATYGWNSTAPVGHDVPIERPDAAIRELVLLYKARGMAAEDAWALAKRMIEEAELKPETGQEGHRARRAETLRQPWEAAMGGFFAFLSGGLIPLLPFLLGVARHPLLIAACLTGVGLLVLGSSRARMASRQALWGGLRNVAVGATAGASAYLLGTLWPR